MHRFLADGPGDTCEGCRLLGMGGEAARDGQREPVSVKGPRLAGRDPASIRRNYNVMGAIDPRGDAQDGELLVGVVDAWVEALGRSHRELAQPAPDRG